MAVALLEFCDCELVCALATERPSPVRAIIANGKSSRVEELLPVSLRLMIASPSSLSSKASSLQTCHHHQALDFVIQVSLEEEVIFSDRHAAIRIATRPEHKGVRKQAGAAKDFLLVFRNQP